MNKPRFQNGSQSGQPPFRQIVISRREQTAGPAKVKPSRLIRFERFAMAALVLGTLWTATPTVRAEISTTGGAGTAIVPTNVIAPADAKELEATWGVQITALRISAAGNVIDFRYRVTDSDKASALGDPKVKPALIDQATGKTLHVPNTKAGQMRSTGSRLAVGRTYTALFANPGREVKPGSKVTIVVGDFRAEDLTVGE